MTSRKSHNGVRRLVQFAAAALTVAAIVQELSRPREERTWHGRVVGVPYDFRMPTVARVRESWWAPEDPRLLTPHVFGVGWSVNLGRLVRLVSGASDSSS